MSLTGAILTAGIASEAAVFGLVLYRQIWRRLPVFFAYCLWSLLADEAAAVITIWRPGDTLQLYLAETVIDAVLLACLLIELAASLLRSIDDRMRRYALLWLAATMLVLGRAVWLLAGSSKVSCFSDTTRFIVQGQQTTAILVVLILGFLAAVGRLLDLRRPLRASEVAKGLGFYTLFRGVADVADAHSSLGHQFRSLEILSSFAYLLSLIYWIFKFAQRDETDVETTVPNVFG